MTIKPAVAGDIGDYRIVRLDGIADLTAVTAIEAHVARGTTTETLVAAVEDATACTVRVELGEDDGWLPELDAPSQQQWDFEVQATFADGSILTWPTPDTDSIDVRPELG